MSKNIPFRYSIWIEALGFVLVVLFVLAIVQLLEVFSR
jgi:hypothetical protein